mgnify:CR=1 FL=1
MSLKETKKIDTNRYQLEITVDGEKFREAIREAYKKNSKKINVPGFRRGKAPLHIIETYYGTEIFFEDALNLLYNDLVDEAITESGLKVINDKMDFEMVSISKEDGADFKVSVTTYPEIEIGEYKGLKAEKTAVKVDAAEVNAEVNAMAERNARMVSVEDRAAKKDDTVIIDFEGFVDGKAFDGGKAEGHSLVLGSGQFIPGFEDQIIGKNIGDEFDVNVTFPEEYGAKELAGKAAVFKVKLHEIKIKELPTVDDEFAKDVSEFDTLDEYKADVKAKLAERNEKAADAEVDEQLTDALIGLVEAEIPEVMYTAETENFVRDYDNRLRMQGLDLSTYFKYTGQNLDTLRQQMRPQAEKQVKMRLALETIAKLENLVATDAELEEEYKRIADGYGVELGKVKEAIASEDIAADVVVKKAFDLVKDAAVITKKAAKKAADKADAEVAEEKPAVKKAAAKKSAPAAA